MSPAPFVCNGHDGLTDRELRRHNSKPCKDDDTRKATNALGRAAYETRQAEKNLTTVETDYVDHFQMPSAAEAAPAPAKPAPVPTPPSTPRPTPAAVNPTTPSHGASRRLRGLAHIGYTPREMATNIGLSEDSIWWLLIAPPATIKTTTHNTIDRAFKSMRVAIKTAIDDSPEVRNAARARALATLNHWSGPFDWEAIDDYNAIPNANRTNKHADRKEAEALAAADLDDVVSAAAKVVAQQTADAEKLLVELADLRTEYSTLDREYMRRAGTINTLQVEARDLRDQLRNVRAENELHAEHLVTAENERRLIDEANTSLHEQLARALFSKPPADAERAQIAATAVTSNTAVIPQLAEATDVFSIEFEPTLAGGFTLKLPTSLLTR